MEEIVRDMYQKADVDGSGFLDFEEFKAFVRRDVKVKERTISINELKKLFRYIDEGTARCFLMESHPLSDHCISTQVEPSTMVLSWGFRKEIFCVLYEAFTILFHKRLAKRLGFTNKAIKGSAKAYKTIREASEPEEL